MALTITATITVTDDQAYTPLEARIIAAMQAHPSNGTAAVVEPAAAEPAAAPKAAPRAKATPKAAPATTAPTSGKAAVLDTTLDEPAAEPEAAADDDLVGGDAEPATEYTLEDAVTLATTRINESKRAQVVAALKGAGVKKVGELKGNAAGLATFMEALA